MKRAFAITITFIFALLLLNSLSWAEETEKKPDEKSKIETEVKVRKNIKKPVREVQKIERKEKYDDKYDRMAYRELLDMIRRQNDQIQQLREEIMKLRRLIEERLPLQVRREEGEFPRRFDQDRPREEYQMHAARRNMDIDSEIRILEDKVSRDPKNIDAHIRLAHLYEERDKIGAAIEQYKIVTKIRPDFGAPRAAIERLEAKQREVQPEEEFNMGEVISSNMEYITIKTFEGNNVAFKVPKVRKDDGTWGPDRDFTEKAKLLDVGTKVRIFWNRIEGQKVIKRIEFLKKD